MSDLSPLRDMKLTYLTFSNTKVSDLSPLKDMPLKILMWTGTPVSDLSPLKDTPLNFILLDFKPERDAEVLRSIKTLGSINGVPATDFWKEVDAKAANKKP